MIKKPHKMASKFGVVKLKVIYRWPGGFERVAASTRRVCANGINNIEECFE
jgi:hypothetical protein